MMKPNLIVFLAVLFLMLLPALIVGVRRALDKYRGIRRPPSTVFPDHYARSELSNMREELDTLKHKLEELKQK